MPRKENTVATVKVQPSVSKQTMGQLNELVRLGYGNTPTEVARFLIQKGLDEYLLAGLIGPGLKRRVKKASR